MDNKDVRHITSGKARHSSWSNWLRDERVLKIPDPVIRSAVAYAFDSLKVNKSTLAINCEESFSFAVEKNNAEDSEERQKALYGAIVTRINAIFEKEQVEPPVFIMETGKNLIITFTP